MNLRVAREYIESCLKIRTKSGAVVPFRLNAAQQKLSAALGCRGGAVPCGDRRLRSVAAGEIFLHEPFLPRRQRCIVFHSVLSFTHTYKK